MLKVLENRSSFADEDLVKQVRRDNNSKRNYLLVDSMQGKHVPADPGDVLRLYSELAFQAYGKYTEKKIIFIGFAETATAVGAGTASAFPGSYYIHTTREERDKGFLTAEFREEHSHAAEQLLYSKEWKKIARSAERIVFVEDEITTGKTIMNFISVLKQDERLSKKVKFSAISILNGMSEERKEELLKEGVDFTYLVKIAAAPDREGAYTYDAKETEAPEKAEFETVTVTGMKDPRLGLVTSEYTKACEKIFEEIVKKYQLFGKRVAVVGTEECMYPAILTASLIEKNTGAESVVTHSSTRSPIIPDDEENYPLISRYRVESLYDENRTTFIYNSDRREYDIVFIVTDSKKEDICIDRFVSAFSKSLKTVLVRWVK